MFGFRAVLCAIFCIALVAGLTDQPKKKVHRKKKQAPKAPVTVHKGVSTVLRHKKNAPAIAVENVMLDQNAKKPFRKNTKHGTFHEPRMTMEPHEFKEFLQEYTKAGSGNKNCRLLAHALGLYKLQHTSPDENGKKVTRDLHSYINTCEANGHNVIRKSQWQFIDKTNPRGTTTMKRTTELEDGTRRVEHVITTFELDEFGTMLVTEYPHDADEKLPDPAERYFKAFTMDKKGSVHPKCGDMENIIEQKNFQFASSDQETQKNLFIFINVHCRSYLNKYDKFIFTPLRWFTYKEDGDTAVFYQIDNNLRSKVHGVLRFTSHKAGMFGHQKIGQIQEFMNPELK